MANSYSNNMELPNTLLTLLVKEGESYQKSVHSEKKKIEALVIFFWWHLFN